MDPATSSGEVKIEYWAWHAAASCLDEDTRVDHEVARWTRYDGRRYLQRSKSWIPKVYRTSSRMATRPMLGVWRRLSKRMHMPTRKQLHLPTIHHHFTRRHHAALALYR